VEYAELTPGRPGFDPVAAALYYAQRLAVHPRHRDGIAHLLARRRPRPSAEAPPGARRLRERGWLPLGTLLDPLALSEIETHLADARAEGEGPRGGVLEYALPDVLRCPHLLAVANDPGVLALAEAHLGCRPTLSMLSVRRSEPRAAASGPGQSFHRDVDDWRVLKLFVYLSDVDEGAGPHVYVEGSHRRRGSLRLKHLAEAEAARLGRPVRVTGAAGFGFVADAYGVHRGEPPRTRPRLMAQLGFSIGPVRLFRYGHRVALAETGLDLDPWVNRLFVARP
jgi:hypothetical protein